MNESVSSQDGNPRVLIVSDLIKAYTTIKIKSIKDIHYWIQIKQIYWIILTT